MKFALGAARDFSWAASNGRAMTELAERLGRELGSGIAPGPLQRVEEEVSRVWKEDGLGEMRVGEMGRALEFSSCYECQGSKYGLTGLSCGFKAALIGAALSYAVKGKVKLTETKCCRKGDNGCAFAVKAAGKHLRNR